MWTLLLSRLSDPNVCLDRRQIDGGQIKIGRAIDKCDWVIPDHEGFVSREHCTIIVGGIDLFVVDTSSYGTALNDESTPLPPHQPVPVKVNDRLLLGDFVIEIAPEGAAARVTAPVAPAPFAASLPQADEWFQPASDPIWNSGPRDNEVHEFLGGAFNDFMGAPAEPMQRRDTGEAFGAVGLGAAFSRPIMAPMTPSAGDFGIPEDWASAGAAAGASAGASAGGGSPGATDPFGGFGAPPRGDDPFASAPFPAAAPSDPFGGFVAPPPGDDPFASTSFPPAAAPQDFGGFAVTAPAVDPFADAPAAVSPSAFGTTGGGADPFADFFTAPIPDPDVPPPLATLPAPAAPPPPVAAALTHPAASPDGGDAAWDAFCDGAGIDLADLRKSPDAMRQLGVMYRQVVLGLSDLIQDRAAFKSEFRLGVTTLAIGRNNPLKMLDPRDTAKIMLDRPMPGFMPADEAIRSAFEDIKKHQMAMLAGVQHALTAVFKRLAPTEIERLLEKAAGERRGLPFRRGVDPWTVYRTVFDALRVDATSNANSVMSVAFREGYEAFLKSDPGRS